MFLCFTNINKYSVPLFHHFLSLNFEFYLPILFKDFLKFFLPFYFTFAALLPARLY